MKGVSKREAFLLFFVSFIGIAAAMYMFLLKPMSTDLNANKQKLSDLESQQAVLKATLPNIESLRNKLNTSFEEVVTSMNEIEQPINEAEFERWVLPLTTKYNMKVLETSFSEPEVVTPVALTEFPAEYDYKIKELVDTYHNKIGKTEVLPTSDINLLLSRHLFVVSTTYARYLYFLDEVTNWDTSIFISYSSYDFLESVATFEFSVYSIEQLQELDKIDYTGEYSASGTGSGSSSDVAHPDLGK